MRSASEILDEIRDLKGLTSDAALGALFNVRQSTVASWRSRNSLPYDVIIDFCVKEGISTDQLFLGKTPPRPPQIATGNGNIQAGGSVRASGGARIGGVHAGRDVVTVQEKGSVWQSADPDLIEVLDLLRDYGSPKLIAELRNKLLQIKKAVEG